MRRFLVLAFVLTMIFPAYCFANSPEVITTQDEEYEQLTTEDEAECLSGFMNEEKIHPAGLTYQCLVSFLSLLTILSCSPQIPNPPTYCADIIPYYPEPLFYYSSLLPALYTVSIACSGN